jgi:hypothetical protein
MKARLGTLIERDGKMTGTLGEAVVVMERDGTTRDGMARWRLMLAVPNRPAPVRKQQAANRRGAASRIERRKAEGIVTLGGDY